ncbi:hypothetical protein A6F68_00940 [Tsuneonella dongtanensis]|uniref:DUF305 domain-containing protein n=1 Tax=Tsuneonella dongtanensis TaxID=692370 RepID=A0A1B2ABP3_9SPHN|nr:DUF305 domain-containing protein [Tsuneonella dongtanensis]ANY19465.1 hypothetical protein A6F68_00940 [Tsuneonella dongtanensis]
MRTNSFFRGILLAGISLSAPTLAADAVPILQPGAPGSPGKILTANEAIQLASARYSPGDVAYMQHMIVHHRQATEMTALVEARTTNPDIRRIARRIAASQADEMKFMTDWLTSRGEPTAMAGMGKPGPGGMDHSGDHAGHGGAPRAKGMVVMEGMATPAQMAALAAAEGTAFDRQFLQLMIAHHRGAVDMTRNLLEWYGTASDPEMNKFTADVVSDQNAEITRMNRRLASLSQDPRATLKPGFRDAGEAIKGLKKLASLEKPAGFFDPENPAGLQPLAAKSKDEKDKDAAGKADDKKADAKKAEDKKEDPNDPRALAEDEKEPEKKNFVDRSSLLDFANTDMAFSGDLLVAGNYHGFNVYRLGDGGMPSLVSSVVCPGGQGDVSIAGNLLVMSVEEGRGRVDCGLQGNMERATADRFRGLRLFDISNPAMPRQVGQVQTCRGSHTHSIVSADDKRLVVYASGTGGVRRTEELAICTDLPGDDTALFSIDVIEVPVANPAAARIVDRPRVFATGGQIAGLWRGGDHGEGTQDTSETDQCHDITVFPAKKLAAGACSGNGIILDISDPLKPRRIDDVTDRGFAYWHSATFSNDGSKVLFTDEWGGGARPRCQAGDPTNWGANAFYAIENGKLVYRGTYKLPAPQGDKENCVAHNGSIIPVPGRDIFVQAWYQGGISVIDFTDPANVKEIAYFDRGPVDKDQLVTGGYWSAYWYRGRIYATEITRGLDVFALEPSEFLTAAEIRAAEAAQYPGDVFNPQTQTQVVWPAEVVAAAEASRKGG